MRSAQALLITPNISAIMATINKIWINPPALYTKNPSIHPIIKITAMRYNKLLIKKFEVEIMLLRYSSNFMPALNSR
jgi:hypothetical protein